MPCRACRSRASPPHRCVVLLIGCPIPGSLMGVFVLNLLPPTCALEPANQDCRISPSRAYEPHCPECRYRNGQNPNISSQNPAKKISKIPKSKIPEKARNTRRTRPQTPRIPPKYESHDSGHAHLAQSTGNAGPAHRRPRDPKGRNSPTRAPEHRHQRGRRRERAGELRPNTATQKHRTHRALPQPERGSRAKCAKRCSPRAGKHTNSSSPTRPKQPSIKKALTHSRWRDQRVGARAQKPR